MCFGGCCPRFLTRKTPGERSSISRESRDFPRVQASADAKHDVSGVIPPFAATPRLQLLRQISGGLATKRRIGRTYPLPCKAMTCRTGDRSEEHTSELQSIMRTSYAVFCL